MFRTTSSRFQSSSCVLDAKKIQKRPLAVVTVDRLFIQLDFQVKMFTDKEAPINNILL